MCHLMIFLSLDNLTAKYIKLNIKNGEIATDTGKIEFLEDTVLHHMQIQLKTS